MKFSICSKIENKKMSKSVNNFQFFQKIVQKHATNCQKILKLSNDVKIVKRCQNCHKRLSKSSTNVKMSTTTKFSGHVSSSIWTNFSKLTGFWGQSLFVESKSPQGHQLNCFGQQTSILTITVVDGDYDER